MDQHAKRMWNLRLDIQILRAQLRLRGQRDEQERAALFRDLIAAHLLRGVLLRRQARAAGGPAGGARNKDNARFSAVSTKYRSPASSAETPTA